ncbi:hypothetical protein I4641_00495 [Waterburya agarophytonicola K14]|uniref:Uncharacterized protein n=1 Tax=Waterburya agarophytonicola KI4 TaxID=2874699 RepID=A0A964BL89_9CYAN|nr:hypothetical protein [Waterburya agarophytonicola]MCC0175459.1 hypothetical protein [Waterburya agarophytonicola KI4]
MQLVFNLSSKQLVKPGNINSTENTALYIKLSMMSRHTCPCCSHKLLRHLRTGDIYWRCSRCYQEMPAL